MLKQLLNRISDKRRRHSRRRGLEESILSLLGEQGVLVLDKEGLKTLGASRKQAFQAVYDLLMSEKAQMRADDAGKVVVMSNEAFRVHMLERAGATNRKNDPVAEWVELGDCVQEGAEFVKLPPERQTLPERKREPWIAFENINLDID